MKFLKTVFQNNIFSIINLYPPFLGAGVKIKKLNDNLDLHVSMNLNIFNRNYVGVHFGGSLYSMCDPFYMLIVMKKLLLFLRKVFGRMQGTLALCRVLISILWQVLIHRL